MHKTGEDDRLSHLLHAILLPSPCVCAELFYKHSPAIIKHEPDELISLWIRTGTLDPLRLLPALMHYEAPTTESAPPPPDLDQFPD